MGINAFFTYGVILGMGVPWRTALGIPLEWVKLAVTETVRRGC